MLAYTDRFLSTIPMYRLMLYYLIGLWVIAAALAVFQILPFSLLSLCVSTLLILGSCWIANRIFAAVFRATRNVESVYISALILALILSPVSLSDPVSIGFLILASLLAMASKYLIAPGRKHIFNPAAFGAAASSFMVGLPVTWWVGDALPLLPFVIIGGLLVARKLRRFDLVLAFTAAALAAMVFTARGSSPAAILSVTLLHSGFFFLAFAMVTEPLTMPPSRPGRIAYGALIGFFFAANVPIGNFYFSPEIALLLGNALSFAVSPKGRYRMRLIEKRPLADRTHEFVFVPDRPISYSPGQYLEWTLGRSASDSRGNRRFFTIASSPTEEAIRLGVKLPKPGSSFKRVLSHLSPGDAAFAANLAGDFTLPKDPAKKLVFIAGGIGITPFRSMVRYLLDTKDTRAVTLFYANKKASEIAYRELFDTARSAMA